jgi:hypothetical protein
LPAYWQVPDIQFKNHHKITGKSHRIQKLHHTGAVSDYPVNTEDLNHTVASVAQAFRACDEAHLPHVMFKMMYMLGPIPEHDDVF